MGYPPKRGDVGFLFLFGIAMLLFFIFGDRSHSVEDWLMVLGVIALSVFYFLWRSEKDDNF